MGLQLNPCSRTLGTLRAPSSRLLQKNWLLRPKFVAEAAATADAEGLGNAKAGHGSPPTEAGKRST